MYRWVGQPAGEAMQRQHQCSAPMVPRQAGIPYAIASMPAWHTTAS
jgi:hypothetical protein